MPWKTMTAGSAAVGTGAALAGFAVGTIGLVASVPITTALAALVADLAAAHPPTVA
jgi:hypothetical protein